MSTDACPNCTEDEYCSDACADADDPCHHGMLETISGELCRCEDCGELVRHFYVGGVDLDV